MKRALGRMLILLGAISSALSAFEAAASVGGEPAAWTGTALGLASAALGLVLLRAPSRPWTYREEAYHRLYLQARGLR